MGLSWSFHAVPDGAVVEFLCGFYGPLVWVVWECRYVGCIFGVAPLWLLGLYESRSVKAKRYLTHIIERLDDDNDVHAAGNLALALR